MSKTTEPCLLEALPPEVLAVCARRFLSFHGQQALTAAFSREEDWKELVVGDSEEKVKEKAQKEKAKPKEEKSKGEKSKDQEGLGDYEKVRASNIAEREQRFAESVIEESRVACWKNAGLDPGGRDRKRAVGEPRGQVPSRKSVRGGSRPSHKEGRKEEEDSSDNNDDYSDTMDTGSDEKEISKKKKKKCVDIKKVTVGDEQEVVAEENENPEEVEEVNFKENNNKKKTVQHGDPKLLCKEPGCAKEFNSTGGLKLHKRTAHEKVTFKCGEKDCVAEYTSKVSLQAHARSKHDEAKLPCEDCGKTVAGSSALHLHMPTAHKGMKPHQCQQQDCPAKFATKQQLRVHLAAKHGQGELNCPEQDCAAQFGTKRQLQDHSRTKHGHVKLPCSEEDCKQKFVHSANLTQHVNIVHKKVNSHKCTLCPFDKKAFATKQELKGHTSAGIDKLYCKHAFCYKSFTRQGSLDYHIKEKHEGNTFKCDVEGIYRKTNFDNRAQLQEHNRNNHGAPKLECRVAGCNNKFDV